MDNRLQEIFDKYNVTEKNNSMGNLKKLERTISELQKLDKVLLLTCSNRYNWDPNDVDIPKSTILAMVINEYLNEKSVLIDVPELNIIPCEGNVSRKDGNSCGLMKSKNWKTKTKTLQDITDVGQVLTTKVTNFGRYPKNYLNQMLLYFLPL